MRCGVLATRRWRGGGAVDATHRSIAVRRWKRQNELHAASGSPYFDRDASVVATKKIGGVPLKRLGEVEEVVEAVAFLLSDESAYITGTSLVVAGGMA